MTVVRLSRRALFGIGASTLLAGLALRPAGAEQPLLPATPQCGDDDDATPAQTEGPYFTPGSPERANLLEQGMTGDRISLIGFVLDRTCQPVPHALLDL